MRVTPLLKISATLLFVLNPLAAMADVNIDDNRQVQTIDCHGQVANINGNQNVLTLKNCKLLNVGGNMNQITVSPVQYVNVSGNMNKVTWGRDASMPPNKQLVVSTGNNNEIVEMHGNVAGATTVRTSKPIDVPSSATTLIRNDRYNGSSQVNIRPNSIKIRGTNGYGASDVNIGPNGINIKSPDGTSINIGN